MSDIHHLVRINASAKEVFKAFTDNALIAQWFTQTQCDDWAQGSSVVWFDSVTMTITEIIEGHSVRLRVVSGGGWDGTELHFSVELEEAGHKGKSILRFDHTGWDSVTDHFRDCSVSWAYFLESLRLFLETGVGTPEGVAPACESDT